MAKNKKMTRNSYKRKIIVLGIMIFMSIALVTTGFAAWVMSRNAQNEDATGNISVGTVQDNAIKFVDGSIKFYTELADDLSEKSKDFKFEPTKGDKEGIVKANDTEYELLELTVKGQIKGYEFLIENAGGDKLLKVKLDLREATGVAAAAASGYISDKLTFAQDSTTQEVAFDQFVEIKVTKVEGQEDYDGEFEFTVSFSWGTQFGKVNPSDYYDKFTTLHNYMTLNHKETYEKMMKAFAEEKHNSTYEHYVSQAGNGEKTVYDFFNDIPGDTEVEEFMAIFVVDAYTEYNDYVNHVVSTLYAFNGTIASDSKYTVILVAEPK